MTAADPVLPPRLPVPAVMRANRSMARTAFRSLVTHQVSFLFGLLATAFAALSMLYLWRAVLANGPVHGFDWPHMKAYLLLTFVASSLVSSYVDYRMAGRIREGDVAMDLVRPVGYQRARFVEALGFGVYELGTGLLVVVVAALAFGGVPGPAGGEALVFAASALLVFPLRFAVVYMSGLLVFWTQNYIGVQAGRIAVVTLCSGALVPIVFLPLWAQDVLAYLPFVGMAATPALVYVGHLTGSEAWRAVGVQAFWVVVLWGLGRAMWGAASRKLTVHGG